jgi:hypothetical protein
MIRHSASTPCQSRSSATLQVQSFMTLTAAAIASLAAFAPISAAAQAAAGTTLISPSSLTAGMDEHGLVIFLADSSSGWIYYGRPSDDPANAGAIVKLLPYTKFESPSGLAYRKGLLYVSDAGSRQLLSINVWETPQPGAPRVLVNDRLLGGVAVSAGTLVAASDVERNELIFVSGGDEIRVRSLKSSDIKSPRQLVFAGDELHVLDNGEDRILKVSEKLWNELEFGAAASWLTGPFGPLTTLASAEAVVYTAAKRDLLLYLAADRSTLPLPWPDGVAEAGAHPLLAAAGDWLFLVGDDHQVRQLRRPVPVKLRLEVSPELANRALTTLYSYLLDRKILPLRSASIRQTSMTPLQLLLDESVLVGPGASSDSVSQDVAANAPPQAPTPANAPAATLLCRLNAEPCAILEQGRSVQVPDVRIRKRILLRLQELSGRTIPSILLETVPTASLRRDVSALSSLSKRNPQLKELPDFSVVTSGRYFLPVEFWELTTAVFAGDFNRKESPLAGLRGIAPGHIFLLSTQPLASDLTAATAAAGTAPPTAPCVALRQQMQALEATIKYPDQWPELLQADLMIGIVESQGSVDMGHRAFASAADSAWVSLADGSLQDAVLPSQPDASSSSDVVLNSAAAPDYIASHHGTHIAGIIGARSPCFAGLLPHSQLYLIDTANASTIGFGIRDAGYAQVPTINVSQSFGRSFSDIEEIRKIVTKQTGTMFVVAAGDDDQDYNDKPDAPPPVSWADLNNILAVTAIESTGSGWNVLSTPRGPVGRGKRYIHLAAPGGQIVSATTGNEFAPGTGTSQAAPQVTAAAAFLMHRDCYNPSRTKARLIATAEWRSQFMDLVWGGLLDFGRAVTFSGDNVLRTRSQVDKTFRINALRGPSLAVTNLSYLYPRDPSATFDAPKKIPLQNILAIRQTSDPKAPTVKYRVVFVDDKAEMHIILDATLSGKVGAKGQEVFNDETKQFKATALLDKDLDFSQITEFYRSCATYPNIATFN